MMAPRSPNADQYRNRLWQCQSRLWIDALSLHADIAYHVCQLERGHFEPHLCWCGCRYDAEGRTYTAQRLPGSPGWPSGA